MEPTGNPNVPLNPETPNTSGEAAPVPAAPETVAQPASQPASTPAPLPVTPAPSDVPAAPANPGQQQSVEKIVPGISANPAEAGDVDVIEKEWVDQANKVVEQTKDDPYVQEEAVESLQQDYLKKRYGHDVKKPDQDAAQG